MKDTCQWPARIGRERLWSAHQGKTFDEVGRRGTVELRLACWRSARQRQLQNAERQLEQRLQGANKLYEMAEANNDAELFNAAERLEQQAASRFQERMEAIQRFAKRHSLNPVAEP